METKCNYCEFFGKKPHCGRCKMLNGNSPFLSQKEIKNIQEFIDAIDNHTVEDLYNIGDYMCVELYTGERVLVYILGYSYDDLASKKGKADVTLGLLCVNGKFMTSFTNKISGYRDSEFRNCVMRYMKLLPEPLKSRIVPVIKKTQYAQGSFMEEELAFAFSEGEINNKKENPYPLFLEEKNLHLFGGGHVSLRSSSGDGFLYFPPMAKTFDCYSAYSWMSYYQIAFGFCLTAKDSESE